MLATATSPAYHAVPRFDALDDAFVFSLGPKPHDVAGSDDVPLIGGERFQKATRGALERVAGVVAHDADQALHAQYAPQAAHLAVHIRQHMRAGVIFENFTPGKRTLSR